MTKDDDKGATGRADRVLIEVPIGALLPNPGQPRQHFEPEALRELGSSIARHGVLQPLLVTEDHAASAEGGARYRIVAGERRWRAASLAGLATVPALLLRPARGQDRELALIENLQRSDLQPLELAQALEALLRQEGLTHEQLAQRLGRSRVAITNTLRLLQLGYQAQRALAEGRISEGHARALLGVHGAAQERAVAEVAARELSVRQTEGLVRRQQVRVRQRQAAPGPGELGSLADALRRVLGTRVALDGTAQSGRIVIDYGSREELERLCERIGGDELAHELG